MAVVFTLDGIDMNNGLRDFAGAMWLITDTGGIFDSPDMRTTILDKSLTHGSVMANSVMDKRRIQLRGVVTVQGTEDNVWRTRDRLVAALTTFTVPKVLQVNQYGVPKTINYWSAGGAVITPFAGGFEFTVTLVCEDPRFFSPVTSTGAVLGAGSSANYATSGSFQTPPVFTLLGFAANANTNPITITNTVGGSVIGTLQVLSYLTPPGETKLVIDAMNRTVQGMNAAGGNVVNRYGFLNTTSLNWFDLVAAGQNNLLALTGVGYNIAPSWRDAYL